MSNDSLRRSTQERVARSGPCDPLATHGYLRIRRIKSMFRYSCRYVHKCSADDKAGNQRPPHPRAIFRDPPIAIELIFHLRPPSALCYVAHLNARGEANKVRRLPSQNRRATIRAMRKPATNRPTEAFTSVARARVPANTSALIKAEATARGERDSDVLRRIIDAHYAKLAKIAAKQAGKRHA